jgi:uncharacterized glyoxalase superfamily protein PhnB
MAEDRQVFTPLLAYDDAPAALEFLCRAFGFEEEFRFDMPDDRIGHAVLRFAGGKIALATTWTQGGMASPLSLPAVHSQVFCEVLDVDAHYERAKAEGATIAEAPGEPSHGSRSYRALDLEGHRWVFATPHASPTPIHPH